MEKTNLQIINEFKNNRSQYELLEQIVASKVKQLIKDHHFFVMEVSHRTKDIDSLTGKLKRKSGKYNKITDITDLVGVRIICFFSDTIDAIAEKLTSTFEIDWKNSIDKRATIQDTQFGYLSLHYICYLGNEYDENLRNIPFEIQIRTVLQHAWAEIEHDLGYKSEFGVPRAIRRNFSQTAGLLEVADRLFVEIRDNSSEYTNVIREKIADNDANDILIDRISLSEYLRINKDILAFEEYLKTALNVEVEEVDSDRFLEQFSWLRVETIGELSSMFDRHREYIYRQIEKMAEDYEIDIISSTVILKYMCEGELIHGKYSDAQMRKFLSLSLSDEAKIERQIKKLKNQGKTFLYYA